MMTTKRFLAAAVVAMVVGAIPMVGQRPQSQRTIPDPGQLPPVRKAEGAFGAVLEASKALGMQRRLGRTHGVIGALFVANGKIAEVRPSGPWPEYKVAKVVGEVTYFKFSQGVTKSPGVRLDYT